jgi:hypothetical protein
MSKRWNWQVYPNLDCVGGIRTMCENPDETLELE